MPKKMLPLVYTSLLFSQLMACNSSSDGEQNIAASAGIATLRSGDSYLLQLMPQAFEQTFLLTSAGTVVEPLPLGAALNPRIVRFERKADRVYLFEDISQSRLATKDLPMRKLIATFPILKNIDGEPAPQNSVTIDVNDGLLDYLLAAFKSNPAADDLWRGTLTAQDLKVIGTYVDRLQVTDSSIFVDQVLNAPDNSGMGYGLSRVKYSLSTYTSPEGFVPKAYDGVSDKVGYFTNSPSFYGDGKEVKQWIRRWDHRQPIVYHVSTNVPEAYKQAVRDGVLYWNRAFGSEVVKVEDLPEGVQVLDPGYNVVQWIDSDIMGFAYADLASDPVTGRTIQAQVYMSDIFAKLPSYFVDSLNSTSQKTPKTTSHRTCFHDLADRARTTLWSLTTSGVSAEVVERAKQDFVRTVIAHEIGHTMGLRHNFVAKTQGTLPPEDFDQLVQTYFADGTAGNEQQHVTSSVMDYLSPMSDILAGAQIRTGTTAFKYDTEAIKWGYSEIDAKDQDFGLYCTDEDVMLGNFIDCSIFMPQGDLYAGSWRETQKLGKSLVDTVASQFLSAKSPGGGFKPIPFEKVSISAFQIAAFVLEPLMNLTNILIDLRDQPSGMLHIDRAFSYVSDVNQEERNDAVLKYQKSILKNIASSSDIFALITPKLDRSMVEPDFLASFVEDFTAHIESDSFRTGVNSDNLPYQVTDEEVAYLKELAPKLAKAFRDPFMQATLSSMTLSNGSSPDRVFKWTQAIGATELSTNLNTLAHSVLLAEGDEEITGTVNGKQITVKQWAYNDDTRRLATMLFSSDLYDVDPEVFNKDGAKTTRDALQQKLNTVTDNGAVEIDNLPPDLKKYAQKLEELDYLLDNP